MQLVLHELLIEGEIERQPVIRAQHEAPGEEGGHGDDRDCPRRNRGDRASFRQQVPPHPHARHDADQPHEQIVDVGGVRPDEHLRGLRQQHERGTEDDRGSGVAPSGESGPPNQTEQPERHCTQERRERIPGPGPGVAFEAAERRRRDHAPPIALVQSAEVNGEVEGREVHEDPREGVRAECACEAIAAAAIRGRAQP